MTYRYWTDKDESLVGVYQGGNQLSRLPGGSGQIATFSHSLADLGRHDCGGPFLLIKTERKYSKSKIVQNGYSGEVTSSNPPNAPSVFAPTTSALLALGTTAIARTTPTNPAFSASQFLGEALQDGVPAMAGAATWRAQALRAKRAQAAGEDYLNYSFGWLPLVSDIRDFAYAVKNSSEIIRKYKKDSGHLIHREYHFPPTEQSVAVSSSQFIKTAGAKSIGSALERRGTYKLTRTWFKGAYKYWLPVGDDANARFRRYESYANKLLGLKITPETLWNVGPWSWAIDWKTDVGDVIHNQSNLGQDGLVLVYGYVMHEMRSDTYSESPYGGQYEGYHYCRREASTPFGFGVNMSNLTTRQVSILAALGLTRTR
jgi:hypothetical protein